MRTSLLFLLLFALSMSAKADMGRLQPVQYNILSDGENKKIEPGHFMIKGTVKMFSSLNPINNVLIGCTSSGTWVRSNEEGLFEITLKSTDSVVYFYLDGWSEVVIENYDFKEQHEVNLEVFMYQGKPDMVRKPVIYMYGPKDLEASVILEPKGELTFTYPEYRKDWKAVLDGEGGVSVDDKKYPYLFWEAESYSLAYNEVNATVPGFLVEKDNVTSFFEEKLSKLGLNAKEQTDFITYWAPLLSHKKYAFIQFVVDEDYAEQVAGIKITPQPDHIRRVYILCSGVDQTDLGFEIVPQELKGFDREGFHVLEWGGSILDLDELAP